MTRTDLPRGFHYAAISYLPGSTQRFVNDQVVNAVLARRAPSTVRRIPKEAK